MELDNENLYEIAEEISLRIVEYAIKNGLLDKSPDEMIEAYKAHVKEEEE